MARISAAPAAGHRSGECLFDLGVAAGPEATVGVDPELVGGHRPHRESQRLGDLGLLRHPGRVDVVHPWPDTPAVAGGVQVRERVRAMADSALPVADLAHEYGISAGAVRRVLANNPASST